MAWYEDNSGYKTHTVAKRPPNELGLYDMSGNVLECCRDGYGSYSISTQINPMGPTSGSFRVRRGGSWHFDARSCRVSFRYGDDPSFRDSDVGFRLALVP